jgi:beta-lactamase regulating signal transducer with metallopeptidase domain
MNDFISKFAMLQSFYPSICLLILAAIKSSAIVCLGWGGALLLKSRSAAARCWVWRCAMLGVLVLLAFDFGPDAIRKIRLTIPTHLDPDKASAFYRETLALKLVQTPENIERAQVVPAPPRQATPPWVSPGSDDRNVTPAEMRTPLWSRIESGVLPVWLSIAAILFAATACRIAAGILWLRRHGTAATTDAEASCAALAAGFGIKSTPCLGIIPDLHSPLILGLRRPWIYLPASFASWSEEKLRTVFVHELAHWKRRDLLWQYLGRLVSCLLWWNPLVSLAARHMSNEAEQAADDAVLLHRSEATTYATALVEIAAGHPILRGPIAGVSMVGHRSLERRIKALLAANPWRGRIGRLAGALITLLFLAFIAASSAYFTYSTLAQGMKKLNSDQHDLLQRIVDANVRRLTALRFLHYKVENTWVESGTGGTITSPQPENIEAWADEWTGIRRIEFRPQVTRWIDGAAPFSITNTTEIADAKNLNYLDQYTDPNHLGGRPRFNGDRDNHLGLDQFSDLVRDCKVLLSSDSPGGLGFLTTIGKETRDGKQLIRLVQQFSQQGKVVQQKTYLVDPSQDYELVLTALTFPARDPDQVNQWTAKEFRAADNGASYPSVFQTINTWGGARTVTDSRVTSLEVLSALPDGITDLPKDRSGEFVARNASPVMHGTLALTFIDSDGTKPVASVPADVGINMAAVQHLTADAGGKLTVTLPQEEIKYLSIRVKASGFAPHWIEWRKYGDPLQLPASYTVKLFPSAPVSGKVIDEQGRPIPGAKVEVTTTTGPHRWSVFHDGVYASGLIETDSNGAWTYPDAPVKIENLTYGISKPGFQGANSYALNYDALRNGSCVAILKRGIQFTGHVQDAAGNPVTNCHLTIGKDRWGTDLPTADTGTDGNFTFNDLSAVKDWLTAEAPGCQPYAVQISLPLSQPLNISLQPGLVLRVKVLHEDGTPAAGLEVGVDTWNQLRTLRFGTHTDSGGRFVWNGAPPEPVTFNFVGTRNGEFLAGLPLTAQDGEQVILLKPALRLLGSAVDASTGKPIKPLRVVPARIFSADDIYWENESAMTYADGSINWKTQRMFADQKRLFRIEAQGYEPLQTQAYDCQQNQYQETFKLTPLPPQ